MRTLTALGLTFFTLLTAAAGGCALDGEAVSTSGAEISGRPYFELLRQDDGDYVFDLSAANHVLLLESEQYEGRTGALNGILSVLDNAGLRSHFEVLEAASGDFYFHLVAGNGHIIGWSDAYASRASADAGVDATIRAVAGYLEYQHQRRGARFDVFEGEDGQFYFNLHAQNGEVVLRSEGYTTEAAALNGVFSVADNGVDLERYEVLEAHGGGYYFNLHATNGQVIGTSEVYASHANAERGCDSIAALLPAIDLL
jgi:uncharacterized protein YegP (UPF0339 family)